MYTRIESMCSYVGVSDVGMSAVEERRNDMSTKLLIYRFGNIATFLRVLQFHLARQ